MSTDPATQSSSLTVYFDGACPVCAKEIAYYHGQVGAESCAWIDASLCDESQLGPGLTRAEALKRFHVRNSDGELTVGVRGFAALWKVLPRTAWLGKLASIGPMPALLEFGYPIFLRVRKLWRPSSRLAGQ